MKRFHPGDCVYVRMTIHGKSIRLPGVVTEHVNKGEVLCNVTASSRGFDGQIVKQTYVKRVPHSDLTSRVTDD